MYLMILFGGGFTFGATVMLVLGVVMGLLVVVRHRSNIKRLLSGTESRFTKNADKKGGK
jgi:glycerol-3-phosphate acyltransferase PlsY